MDVRVSKGKDYAILSGPSDYEGLNISYVSSNDEISDLIDRKKKAVIFVSSKSTGKKLCEKLEETGIDVEFISSENKQDESADVVAQLEKKEKFSAQVLITTSVMDVGVNIKDKNVTQIFVRSYEPEQLLQMIGRLRVPRNAGYEGITLYLCDVRLQDLERKKNSVQEVLEVIEKWEKVAHFLTPTQFYLGLSDYERERCRFMYLSQTEGEMHVSKISIYRYRKLYDLFFKMYENCKDDTTAYIKEQLSWLGRDDFSTENYAIEEVRKKRRDDVVTELATKMADLVEKEFTKSELDERVLSEAKLLFRKLDCSYVRSNASLSVKRFNEICKMETFPYQIVTKYSRPTKYTVHKCNIKDAIKTDC